ncbi:MAG TPA: aminotransferase class I/II-fold pyridoxal phosphate-dependent enzyme [Steroidobacteraceae bacterium]|nr:aminotransferase class I/II-fold pyridoxal phosphate-dependent enzyme [Steroidobacteraceae bacterium]
MSKQPGANTLCVHAARSPDAATGAVAEPIYLSTTFERDADGAYPRGYRYSREGTPNRTALESCLAALEGGAGAVAFSSGLAASMALVELLEAGDRLVAPLGAYYGTLRQFTEHARRRGIVVECADFRDPHAVEAAAAGRARLLWIETPTNPLLNVTDLARVTAIGHQAGALVVCDNTFATPICQRPFDFGVDLVVHSGTKYLGGHSDVLSGAVIAREAATALERLRAWQTMAGAALAPFDCWLLRRSLATLALRVRAQCAGAFALAGFLASHRAVEQVFYPGLPDHPQHALAARQMPGGFGAVLSVCIAAGREAAMRTAARTRLFTRATSLGGVESLIEHRASIEGPGSRTPQNLLRLAVGIEEPADLIDDLAQALE